MKKKKEFVKQINTLNHLRANTTGEFKYNPFEENKSRKGAADKEKILQSKIRDLEEENCQLRQVINIKDNVIIDITEKIKLLEEAIEEHEKSLTARDNLMDEFQKREKEYLIHIDELEKHIDNLIKGKNADLDYTK